MTRVKICGITRIEDALTAAREGADAIGMIFYSGSVRHVTREVGAAIAQALPPFVASVALFVNPSSSEVLRVIDAVLPDILQFHGEEDEVFCSQFGMGYLKAIRVGPETDLLQCAEDFQSARGLVLDADVAGCYGGTGQTFDWTRIPRELQKPLILSGGLTPGNVGVAVRTVRPWAIDVSSGVEVAKGIKDPRKITEFIREVRNADV